MRTPSKPGRSALASLSLAATLLMGGPSAAETTTLEKEGWTLITASDETFVYMKAAGAPQHGMRRVWTAYDSEKPRDREGFAFKSVRSLGEFDCQRRVSRVVHETYHAERALKGKSWEPPNFVVTDWAAPEPESVGAIRMAFACRALSET